MARLRKSRPSSSRSRWRKLLFSAVTTLAFFLLVEAGLALLGVGPVTNTRDPFVGFSSRVPLLEASVGEDGQPAMSIARNKLVWFNAQTFLRHKPEGTYRIFCLGGSTTYGRPYWDTTSYAGWLRKLLPLADKSRQWEVINAGGVSYASYRVASVLEELTRYEPDLFIVYSVHNEFLERRTYEQMFRRSGWREQAAATLYRTRTGTLLDRLIGQTRRAATPPRRDILPGEVDEMLNHTIGPADYHRDDQWRDRVLHHYEVNLLRMVTLARQAGADIVFITPASNEQDCSPFKSEFRAGFSDDEVSRFRSRMREADQASEAGEHAQALAALRAASSMDDKYAAVHYRIGKVQLQLGRSDEALAAFRRALNDDVCPLRAVDEITESLRRVARTCGVPLVDFEQRLRTKSQEELGQPCLGREYFLDHVHPTIEVHRQLALWIVEDLQQHGLTSGDTLDEVQVKQVTDQILALVDRPEHGIALRNLAKVFHWAGKFDEALPLARAALEMMRDDPESLFVMARCLWRLGRPEEAISQFQRLLAVSPDFSRAYIPCGCLLTELGELQDAKLYLAMGVLVHPESFEGQYTLGMVHVWLEEFELAVAALQQANKLRPNDPHTILLLAQASAEAGETEQAIRLLENILLTNADDAQAHNCLGEILLDQQRIPEAFSHFEAAVQADASHAAAQANLEAARGMMRAASAGGEFSSGGRAASSRGTHQQK